jgi:riboflavin synthase
MFTGIITDIGHIASAEQRGDLRLIIHCNYDMGSVDLGASIACSGCCLTVIDKGRAGLPSMLQQKPSVRRQPACG